MLLSTIALALGMLVIPTRALTPSELRARSIYQVLTDRFAPTPSSTWPNLHSSPRSNQCGLAPDHSQCDTGRREYCGGTWKGIESRLDYIQDMGFDTVWVSPIVANIEGRAEWGEAYHGYWASDITRLNAHYGTKQDLLDLSTALHNRDMYLMVDVAINHLGYHPSQPLLASHGPFNQQSDYHPYCKIADYENQTQVEQCWLSPDMADLNTESPRVVAILNAWIASLVHEFGVDALRVDTVKHVRMGFWDSFEQSAGIACLGEVWHGDPAYVAPYQEHLSGLFDYATFYHLRRAFASPKGSMTELIKMARQVQMKFVDPSLLATFLDNHDNPRFAHDVLDQLVKNAAIYPMIGDGIPLVYQGQENGLTGGDDPYNREAQWLHGFEQTEMYKVFQAINEARRQAATAREDFHTTSMKISSLSTHDIALSKSPLLSILTNAGSRSPIRQLVLTSPQSGYSPLTSVVDVLSCETFKVDWRGRLRMTLVRGEPRVFLPVALRGKLCGELRTAGGKARISTAERRLAWFRKG